MEKEQKQKEEQGTGRQITEQTIPQQNGAAKRRRKHQRTRKNSRTSRKDERTHERTSNESNDEIIHEERNTRMTSSKDEQR